MKKVMGLLLLSSLWSGVVEASAGKQARIEEPCKVKVEPQVSFFFKGKSVKSYPLTSINNLNTLALLMGDTSEEDTQAIPLDMSAEDFEVILLLMNDQETIGTKHQVLIGFLDAADNRLNKMVYLLEKVRFLEPVVTTADGSKTFDSVRFYPLVIAFFNEINWIENIEERDQVLRGLNPASLMLLLDSLLLFAVQDDFKNNSYDQEFIRQALALVWNNDYLRNSLSRLQKKLLVESIKKRALFLYERPHSGDRQGLSSCVRLYLNTNEGEQVDAMETDEGEQYSNFPISVKDVMEIAIIDLIEGELKLDNRGLTSLDGLKEILTTQQIIRINISDNKLDDESLRMLQDIPQLALIQELNFSGNKITEIRPETFADLTALQSLSLDGNQLTELQPGVFAGLTELQELYLGGNQLTELQRGVFAGLTALKKLNLVGNQLTELQPGVFAGLAELEYLSLYQNKLTELQPGVFADLTALRLLNLASNQLTELQSGVFAGLAELKYLYLDGNQLTEQNNRAIEAVLPAGCNVVF